MVKVGVKLIALQPCKQCIVYMRCVELPESQPKETKGTLWSNSNINSPINKAKGKLSRKREKFGNFIKGGGRSPNCLSGKLCLGEDAHVIVMPECSLCAFWVISLCWMSVLWALSECATSVLPVFSMFESEVSAFKGFECSHSDLSVSSSDKRWPHLSDNGGDKADNGENGPRREIW